MAINVDVKVSKTSNIGAKTKEAVLKYLEKGSDRGFAEYLEQMPVDRANMQQNSYEPTRDGDRIRYGTRDIPYAEAVDKGTGAYWAPIDPLKSWADRVVGDEGFAYYVQWKIAQEGITGQEFSREAIEAQINWYNSHSVDDYLRRELD